MNIRSIGFIGSGAFALFALQRIREKYPRMTIIMWDKNKPSTYTREDAAQCDVVVFAVPPKQYESSMREIIPLMRKDAIIVDICTVKVHTVKLLHELCDGRAYIATHPMFGPQSYIDQGNTLKGLEVAWCESTLPSAENIALKKILTDTFELSFIEISPEDHDRDAAEEQLLTQHIGTIVREAGFARSARGAHTKSSKHFYTAMEIVKDDGPLFDEASDLNPFWSEIEARFELGVAARRLAAVKRRNGKH